MTEHADAVCIHFGLLLEKGDATPASYGQQEPVVVSCRGKGIDTLLVG